MDIIEAKKITKKFNSFTAVDNISFAVKEGEIFGFLGPNGAGKTTTIRVLTGVLLPDSGRAIIGGVDMVKNPIEAKCKIGVIPEIGNTYLDLSAIQNILLAGKFYGIKQIELKKRASELLEKLGLYERRSQPVKSFSKGQKQRISIASAIVHRPKILFLDEPTSGLDVQSQRLIRDIIKEMNDLGTTIFLTTHNIEEANILCDQVCIINNGRIAAIDKPEALRSTIEKTKSVQVSFNKKVEDGFLRKKEFISKIDRYGDKLRLYTEDPDKTVKFLADYAEDKGLQILTLEILKASLEDAFIKFVKEKKHG
ncbi:MAG: ABC transporter ATP-binding protein [Actinomycetota bacterium]